VNVSNKWAHQQELRLMDAHTGRAHRLRGMLAMKSQIFGAGLFQSKLGKFVEDLVTHGVDETKESDTSDLLEYS
jgi:hypothetical protein